MKPSSPILLLLYFLTCTTVLAAYSVSVLAADSVGMAQLETSTPTIAPEVSPTDVAATWDIAWSPDGERLATAHSGGRVYIRDASGRILQTLSGHESRALAVAWSPDGYILATGGLDSTVRIWNTETGELVQEIEASGDGLGVLVLAWQPTGQYLIASGFDTFRAWDTTTWQPVTKPLSVTLPDLKWKPDGSEFAFAATSNVGTATLQNDAVDVVPFSKEHTEGLIYSVAWSADGSQLISGGGYDGSVRLWDAETGEQLAILLQTEEIVTDAVFTGEDNRQIAAITEEGNLYFVDTVTQEIVQTMSREAKLLSVVWNDQEGILAVAGTSLVQGAVRNPASLDDIQSTGFLELIPVTVED